MATAIFNVLIGLRVCVWSKVCIRTDVCFTKDPLHFVYRFDCKVSQVAAQLFISD